MTATRELTRPVASLTRSSLHQNGDIFSLCLVTGKGSRTAAKWYRLTRLASDFGTAFRLTPTMGDKLAAGTEYEVLLDGTSTSCSCPGFEFTSGCKHAAALLQFQAEGRI